MTDGVSAIYHAFAANVNVSVVFVYCVHTSFMHV